MRELLSTPHVRVLFDAPTHLIRFVRTEEPYPSVVEMLALHERVGKLFDSLRRDRCVLLVDMRLAPLNNDPAFEKPADHARAILVRGIPRVAVLVKTVVGTLQVGRHLRADRLAIALFNDEAAALEHLTKPPSESAPRSRGAPESAPRSSEPQSAPPRTASVPESAPRRGVEATSSADAGGRQRAK